MLLISSWCNLFTYKTTYALTIPSAKNATILYNMNIEVKFFSRAYIYKINPSKISIRTKSDPREEETDSRKKKKRKKEKSKGMEICPVTYDNRLETILKRSFITVNSMYHWNTAVSEVSTFSSLLSSPFSGGWQLLEIRYISLARHLSRMSFSLKEFFELLHTQVLQWHFWMTKCVFNCSSRSCVIWFAIRLAIWGRF